MSPKQIRAVLKSADHIERGEKNLNMIYGTEETTAGNLSELAMNLFEKLVEEKQHINECSRAGKTKVS